jgi:hypothetical protein
MNRDVSLVTFLCHFGCNVADIDQSAEVQTQKYVTFRKTSLAASIAHFLQGKILMNQLAGSIVWANPHPTSPKCVEHFHWSVTRQG